jgi:hypothetical protein
VAGAQYSPSLVQLMHESARNCQQKVFELSKSKCTMAGSNVADRAANFSKNFWPPAADSTHHFSRVTRYSVL